MKRKKLFQVRIGTSDGDTPASEPLNTIDEAQARLAEVRAEIAETWENPDPDAAYIHIISR